MENLASFSGREHGSKRVLKEIRNFLVRKLTKNSSHLFLRGGDVISVGPLANNVHEPDLTRFIEHCALSGYADFLIDIGANIGLTTAQNGTHFRKITCFEPNPLCVHILKVNVAIAGIAEKVEVCEYGLGNSPGEYELWVPRHNWGGAFVKNADNSYSDDLLIKKDGIAKFDKADYLVQTITIKSAAAILSEKFAALSNDGLNHGVIKIDVEGMEYAVLQGIAEAIPADLKAIILFENWDEQLDHQEISGIFDRRNIDVLKLDYRRPFKRSWPRPIKALALAFSDTDLRLHDVAKSTDRAGDIVLRLD